MYGICLTINAMIQDEEAVQQLTERMKSMLGPFVLRRLKSDVASQLTAKQHKVEMVSMTDSQAELYTAAVQELKAQVAASSTGAHHLLVLPHPCTACSY